MTKYVVTWNKKFTSGNLKGLVYDARLDFNNPASALDYVKFLCAHESKAVESFSSSWYTCHDVKMVSEIVDYEQVQGA